MNSDRRGFFKKLLGLAGMVVAAPVVAEAVKPAAIPAIFDKVDPQLAAESYFGFPVTISSGGCVGAQTFTYTVTDSIPGTVCWIDGAGYVSPAHQIDESFCYFDGRNS